MNNNIDLKELNKWASNLSIEDIENLPEEEILTYAMERPGHTDQFGFMLELPYFKSQEHLAEVTHALMTRLGKIENLKEKMKELKWE